MDGRRFDEVVKGITGTSLGRRGALGALAGAGLAAVLGRVGAAAATCRRQDQTCGDGRGGCCGDLACCRGRCRNLRRDERFCGDCRTACAARQGQTCKAGACVCADGRPACGAQCCPADCSCSANNRCQCPVR